MSFAHHDIEDRVAQVVPADAPDPVIGTAADRPAARVLVISKTASIGQGMAAEMASDPGVEGHMAQGVLSLALNTPDLDLSLFSFVVFEISDDPNADLEALAQLQSMVVGRTHFIAMSGQVVADSVAQAFTAAGVHEILTVGLGQAPVEDAPEPVVMPATSQETLPSVVPQSNTATNGKITVVLRARGGAGASTLAVNLAVCGAENHGPGKVALIDLDIQNGAVGLMLDMTESVASTAFVKGTAAIDPAFVEGAMMRHDSGLDVMTAPDVFAPLTAIKQASMAALLANLQDRYEHIILDMPQAIVEWMEPVMAAAARVVIVSDVTLPSVIRTRRLMDVIAEEHMTLPIEVVINRHKRPTVMSATLKEVARLMGRPLTHWVPADPKAMQRASDMGQPLAIAAKRARVTRAIATLSDAFLSTPEQG